MEIVGNNPTSLQAAVQGLPSTPPAVLRGDTVGSAQNAEIRRLEQTYGVDISVQPNGDYLIRVAPDENSSGYNVSVTPIAVPTLTDDQKAQLIGVQQALVAEHVGVVHEYNAEAQRLNQEREEILGTRGGGHEGNAARAQARERGVLPYVTTVSSSDPQVQLQGDYSAIRQYADITGFAGSPLNRVAVVAASARTNFEVPAEVFAADPFFGGAGPGADLVPGGGPGGRLSLIGIAHDTDWFVGYTLGRGPLADLNAFAESGRVPSGLHGLDFSALVVPQEDFDRLVTEQQMVPGLRHTETYDGPGNVPGWDITFRNVSLN